MLPMQGDGASFYPGQKTRSHMPHLRVYIPQLRPSKPNNKIEKKNRGVFKGATLALHCFKEMRGGRDVVDVLLYKNTLLRWSISQDGVTYAAVTNTKSFMA